MSRDTRAVYRRLRRMQEHGTVQRLTNRQFKHGCCKRVGCVRRGFLTRPLDACDGCMERLLHLQWFLGWWFQPPPDEGVNGVDHTEAA